LTLATYTASQADLNGGSVTLTLRANGNSPCPYVESQKTITFYAPPIGIITGDPSICNGTSTVLSAASSVAGSGSIYSYQWYKDGQPISGANANTITVNTAGNYSVEITNTRGCKVTACP